MAASKSVEEIILRNEPEVDFDVVADQVLLSRQLLLAAQCDEELFNADQQVHQEELRILLRNLDQQKFTAESAIRSCASQAEDQQFLPKFFQKFGRKRSEALPFRSMPARQIQELLLIKLRCVNRRIDLVGHRHYLHHKRKRAEKQRQNDLKTVLADKMHGAAFIYRDDPDTYHLQLILRNTRKMTQSLADQMTFFDMLIDIANKFSRIKDYVGADAVWFNKVYDDLVKWLELQKKDREYLTGVFRVSSVYFSLIESG